MTELKDIYWLAGLLEGEGCFGLSGSKGSARISLAMTDLDIIEKAAGILGGTVRQYPPKPNRKQVYKVEIFSSKAVGWMMTLFPLMGERRKQRMEKSIDFWKQQKRKNPQGAGRRVPRCKAEGLVCESFS